MNIAVVGGRHWYKQSNCLLPNNIEFYSHRFLTYSYPTKATRGGRITHT